jgi:hypothetical protein
MSVDLWLKLSKAVLFVHLTLHSIFIGLNNRRVYVLLKAQCKVESFALRNRLEKTNVTKKINTYDYINANINQSFKEFCWHVIVSQKISSVLVNNFIDSPIFFSSFSSAQHRNLICALILQYSTFRFWLAEQDNTFPANFNLSLFHQFQYPLALY